jgi:pentatricopeptide repeat protein
LDQLGGPDAIGGLRDIRHAIPQQRAIADATNAMIDLRMERQVSYEAIAMYLEVLCRAGRVDLARSCYEDVLSGKYRT